VIIWWRGGCLPEQNPTLAVRAGHGGSWLVARDGSWLATTAWYRAVVVVIDVLGFLQEREKKPWLCLSAP